MKTAVIVQSFLGTMPVITFDENDRLRVPAPILPWGISRAGEHLRAAA
jgi:hypothetical protein